MPTEAEKYSFFDNVLEVVRLIPPGRVTTYGAIAEYLGSKRSASMVGWALNKCPADVPAQRVVNRLGMLSGAPSFGEERPMDALLRAEGVAVEGQQVLDFKSVFWHPRELDAGM